MLHIIMTAPIIDGLKYIYVHTHILCMSRAKLIATSFVKDCLTINM